MSRWFVCVGVWALVGVLRAGEIPVAYRTAEGRELREFIGTGREVRERTANGSSVLPTGGKWTLSGDWRALRPVLHWNITLAITGPGPTAAGKVDRLSRAKLRLIEPLAGSGADDPGGRPIAFFLWIAGGEVTRVVPIGMVPWGPPGRPNDHPSLVAEASVSLTPAEVDGLPAAILVQQNEAEELLPSSPTAPQDALSFAEATGDSARLDAEAMRAAQPKKPKELLWLLRYAAERGTGEMLRALIRAKAVPDEADPNRWAVCVAAALNNGRTAAFEALAGFPGFKSPRERVNLALEAIRRGHEDAALRLLRNGSGEKLDVRRSPWDWVELVEGGSAPVLRAVVGDKLSPDSLPVAEAVVASTIDRGHDELAVAMLEGGFSPKLPPDAEGNTLLHRAARKGLERTTAFLIRARVRIDAINSRGETPLLVALRSRNFPVARQLVAAGAKVSLADSGGTLPLHLAAEFGEVELLRALLEKGSPLAVPGKPVSATLLHAFLGGSRACIAHVVEAGAKLDPTSPDFPVGLEEAIAFDEATVLQRAADGGWDPSRPLNGWPVATVATEYRASRVLAWLAGRGLQPPADLLVDPVQCSRAPELQRLVFPAELRESGLFSEGVKLTVRGVVTPEGKLRFPIVGGAASPAQATVLRQLLKGSEFSPAEVGGRAVAARLSVSFQIPPTQRTTFTDDEVASAPIATSRAAELGEALLPENARNMRNVERMFDVASVRLRSTDNGVSQVRTADQSSREGSLVMRETEFGSAFSSGSVNRAAGKPYDPNSRVAPAVPPGAGARHEWWVVGLDLLIEADGRVTQFGINRNDLPDAVRARIEHGIRGSTFAPAILDGRAVRCWTVQYFRVLR